MLRRWAPAATVVVAVLNLALDTPAFFRPVSMWLKAFAVALGAICIALVVLVTRSDAGAAFRR